MGTKTLADFLEMTGDLDEFVQECMIDGQDKDDIYERLTCTKNDAVSCAFYWHATKGRDAKWSQVSVNWQKWIKE